MSKLLETIFSLCPSKKKWKSWSLPIKLTAIGALVGIPLAILLFVLSIVLSPDVEAIIRKVADEYKTELTAKYPVAYTVFGVHQNSFVVPKGLMPENLEVDWNTGDVQLSVDNQLVVTFPNMVLNGRMLISGNVTSVEKRIGAKSNSVIRIGQFDPRIEVIGIDNNLIVVALGIQKSD